MSTTEEEQPTQPSVVQTPQNRLKSLMASDANKKKLIMLSLLVLALAIAIYFFIIKKKNIPTEIPNTPIVA